MKKSLLFATKPVDSEKKLIEKEELEKILLQNFGHSCFRGKQLEAIQAVLSGRDCFCLMPTGGGKSMCYQIPALVKPGIVLVVSPLIALMENQVAALRVNGIRAEFLSSTQTVHAKEKIHEDLDSGKPLVKLLYVTPELIATFGFKSKLTKLHSRGLLSLIAIDEAHCISSWGHDFRPSYRKLSSLRSQLPGVPLLAVTATAVPKVQSDVIESLGLQRPLVLKASFNRPNIFYEVRYKDLLDDVYLDISKLIKSTESACSIIYCLERSACDELSAYLAKKGISCAADLSEDQVLDKSSESTEDEEKPLDSTNDGIDRKDVRIVCHFNIPKSMESFYQESGRAGRDQLPSRSILYYGLDDRKRMEFILSSAHASKKSHSSSSSDVLLNKSMTNFAQMVKYCEGSGCRRKKILESFGEQQPTSFCQKNCDTCMHPNKIAAYLGQLATSQNVCQKIFVKSSFNVTEDSGTEFWNREDEIQSPDDDISDSDDGTAVLEKIRMSKVSSKSKVNMKIDALQRAEESYYKKKDDKKQTGVLSNKIIIPDKLREASKVRLLNGLKLAQERSGKLMDLHAASAVLEMECYKKYGKVRKTFYISQVASIIRWLSTSTYGDICNRLNENCTTPHIEVDFSESSSTPQNFAFKEDFPIRDSKEGTNACCNCKPETYFQHPWEKPTSQRNDLSSIPSLSEFVKQNVKAGASKENSQSSIGMQMRNIPRDDAKKRPRLQ